MAAAVVAPAARASAPRSAPRPCTAPRSTRTGTACGPRRRSSPPRRRRRRRRRRLARVTPQHSTAHALVPPAPSHTRTPRRWSAPAAAAAARLHSCVVHWASRARRRLWWCSAHTSRQQRPRGMARHRHPLLLNLNLRVFDDSSCDASSGFRRHNYSCSSTGCRAPYTAVSVEMMNASRGAEWRPAMRPGKPNVTGTSSAFPFPSRSFPIARRE